MFSTSDAWTLKGGFQSQVTSSQDALGRTHVSCKFITANHVVPGTLQIINRDYMIIHVYTKIKGCWHHSKSTFFRGAISNSDKHQKDYILRELPWSHEAFFDQESNSWEWVWDYTLGGIPVFWVLPFVAGLIPKVCWFKPDLMRVCCVYAQFPLFLSFYITRITTKSHEIRIKSSLRIGGNLPMFLGWIVLGISWAMPKVPGACWFCCLQEGVCIYIYIYT